MPAEQEVENEPDGEEEDDALDQGIPVVGGTADGQGMVLLDASVGKRVEQANGVLPPGSDNSLEIPVQSLLHVPGSDRSAEFIARLDGQQAVEMPLLPLECRSPPRVGDHVADRDTVPIVVVILADPDDDTFHGAVVILLQRLVHPIENPPLETAHMGVCGILLPDQDGNGVKLSALAGKGRREG